MNSESNKETVKMIGLNHGRYMKRFVFAAILGGILGWLPNASYAAYTIKEGRLINMHEIATLSVQEHYSLVKKALEEKNWQELARQANIIIKNFPETAFAWDSYFYLGEAYFYLRELDLANVSFSSYLKQSAPKFFEEAIEYKFQIAQAFEKGERRRLLGLEGMPKWMTAYQEAIEIYDEVIMAMPQHDLAVQALLGKGNLQFKEGEYKESIETYQTLIRRFPKHPLACDSYVEITQVYLTQVEKEFLDPDYLDLAEINARKFKAEFPSHPKIAEIEKTLAKMRELYAGELYETAQFYERTKKPRAAMIYYSKILSKYPQTEVAGKSQRRLNALQAKFPSQEGDLDLPKQEQGVLVESQEEGAKEVR